MRYFIKIPNIASAETDAAAERLIARGYAECPYAYFMTWWKLRDAARGAEMGREGAEAAPVSPPPAPLVAKEVAAPLPPGWVRASKVW